MFYCDAAHGSNYNYFAGPHFFHVECMGVPELVILVYCTTHYTFTPKIYWPFNAAIMVCSVVGQHVQCCQMWE